jgi:hypothetical protein
MSRTRKAAHVSPNLGDQDLGHALPDTRDGVQARERLSKRAHPLRDLGAHASDAFVESVDVAQLLGEKKTLVWCHPASQVRLGKRIKLILQRMTPSWP